MQKQQKIILLSGIVLALMAVFMIKIYLDQQRQIIKQQERKRIEREKEGQVSVLLAKKDIPKGSEINADSVEENIIPKQFAQPRPVTSLDRIAGMVAILPISKGEQITLTKLQWPQEATGGSLASATPVGKRAITISVDNIAALAGMIKPGDYVDVIAMVNVPMQTPEGKQAAQTAVIPLFQNILVLAVGREIGAPTVTESRYKEEKKEVSSSLITLALSPQEASLVAFVQEQGKIRLTLRSPADSQAQPFQLTTWDTLFQYVMPKEVTKPEIKEARVVEYVEIYRGLSKERIPLSK